MIISFIMEILGKLFGSSAKVKIMRLFIFNPESAYSLKDVRERTRTSSGEARREISLLTKIKLLKKRSNGKKGTRWSLDDSFEYYPQLKKIMMDAILSSRDDITKKVSKSCKLKTLVFSGFFINNPDSRADIMIIAQSFKKDALRSTIKKIESEIGKEIRYVILDQGDFSYRQSIGDRLIRDIFDYPHLVAVDRLGLVERA